MTEAMKRARPARDSNFWVREMSQD